MELDVTFSPGGRFFFFLTYTDLKKKLVILNAAFAGYWEWSLWDGMSLA